MQPLGSITNLLRFLDSQTQEELRHLMVMSESYAQFLQALVEYVLMKDSSPELVSYCAQIAVPLTEFSLLQRLSEKYEGMRLVEPYFNWARLHLGEESVENLLASIELALKVYPPDWIAFGLLKLRWECGIRESFGSVIAEGSLDLMVQLLKSNQDLSHLESYVLYYKSEKCVWEGDLANALNYREGAAKCATEHNDLMLAIPIMREIASILKDTEPVRAIELLDKVEKMYGLVGVQISEDSYIHRLRANVHVARGEFDLAIDYHMKAIEITEKRHTYITRGGSPVGLAFIYNEIGLFDDALEWGRLAVEQEDIQPNSYPTGAAMGHLQMARAQSGLGLVEEAEAQIELGHKILLKSGSELAQADYYLACGALERQQGQIASAVTSFEKAFEISGKAQKMSRTNSSMLQLVECELIEFNPTSANILTDSSGPWMIKLEKLARERNLPGILGLVLLQKSELRLTQGRDDDSTNLFKEVEFLSDQHSLRFLKDRLVQLTKVH
ncbi:MAG: hypothetical protein RTU63_08250 [Candidatus Thorarchaeota archaeon]